MTDYSELVKALRWCDADFMHECDNCLYLTYKHNKDDCMDRMLRDAADAIEALQAKVDKQDAEITELLAVITKKDTELDNIKTELLNAQDEAKYERQRLRLCEENLEATHVSETTYREMCEALQAEVKRLQDKLCDWCMVCPKERRKPEDCELLSETPVMYGPSEAKMEVQE